MTKFQYTNVRIKTQTGTVLKLLDCQLDVHFPEGYDHLNAVDSPIEQALVDHLRYYGFATDNVYYTANEIGGRGRSEQRELIRMGGYDEQQAA